MYYMYGTIVAQNEDIFMQKVSAFKIKEEGAMGTKTRTKLLILNTHACNRHRKILFNLPLFAILRPDRPDRSCALLAFFATPSTLTFQLTQLHHPDR